MAALAAGAPVKFLYLAGTKVSDEGVRATSRSPLERLDLSRTAVTDAGLAPLALLKPLRFLTIKGARVTPAGLDALRQARPSLKVD